MMLKKYFRITTVIIVTMLAASTLLTAKDKEQPKLVVGIVLDQMRWDYLYRYAHHYGDGGFKKMMNEGFSCERTYIPYLPTYTAPGHASIYTGTVPAVHGIVANDWFNKLTNKRNYCTGDDGATSIGGDEKAGKMSPKNMLTTTIADELKLATNERSKSFGISIKDRGAILPAGHMADGAYWYDSKTGNFITSDFYHDALPVWLDRFNQRNIGDSLMNLNWYPARDMNAYTQSTVDDAPYEGNYKWAESQNNSFPHLTFQAVDKNDKAAIQTTPYGNTLITLLAEELISQEKLGQGKVTDFLAISYSSTDYLGHFYGPNAMEIEDTYIRMDQELTQLFHYLDQKIGKGEYVVFLTADHGGAHNANYLKDRKVPAKAQFIKEWVKALNEYLNEEFQSNKLVKSFMNYQVHLDEDLIQEKNINRVVLKREIMNWLEQQEGISISIDLEGDMPFRGISLLKDRSQKGYHPQRSGSIQLILYPGWYSGFAETGTTHGGWYAYDAHIPLLFYGKNIPKGKTYKNYYMTDIAPTIAAMLNIQEPNGCIGEVILELMEK